MTIGRPVGTVKPRVSSWTFEAAPADLSQTETLGPGSSLTQEGAANQAILSHEPAGSLGLRQSHFESDAFDNENEIIERLCFQQVRKDNRIGLRNWQASCSKEGQS